MLRQAKHLTVGLVVVSAIVASAPAPPPSGPLSPALPASAAAAAPGTVDLAVRRLQAAQRSDGGFAPDPEAPSSDPGSSTWAALALAAVGVHPADQPAKGTTVLAYLRGTAAGLRTTGDLSRLLLVLRASGEADDAAGRRASRTLLGRQARAGGAWPDDPGDGPGRVEATAFAVLALRGGSAEEQAAAARGAAWLRQARTGDGWGAAPGASPRTRPTALALQALRAGDGTASDGAAQAFLQDRISDDDGGIGDREGAGSDPVSTAWGAQGLLAIGVNPLTPRQSTGTLAGDDGENRTVRTYLRARQRDGGGFGSTIRTAQVLPGLNGTTLPLAAVGRGSAVASERAPATPNAARSGGAGGSDGLDDAKATDAGAGGDASAASSAAAPSSGTTGSGAPTASAGTGRSAPPDATTGTTPATTTAATPPAATTGPAPPASPDADGRQVSGSVVGAGDAPDPAGVAAGGAGDGGDRDRAALVLALAALAAAGLGVGLERRGPRATTP